VPLFDLSLDEQNSEDVRAWILSTVGKTYTEEQLRCAVRAFVEVYEVLSVQSDPAFWVRMGNTEAEWAKGFATMRWREAEKMRDLLERMSDGTLPEDIRIQILTTLGQYDYDEERMKAESREANRLRNREKRRGAA